MPATEHVPRTAMVLRSVDGQRFRDEVFNLRQPAVLKGLVRDWPSVRAATESAARLSDYLMSFYGGAPFQAFAGDAAMGGRFFYNDDLTGFNFHELRLTLENLLARLSNDAPAAEPRFLYAGSLPIRQYFRGLEAENTTGLVPSAVEPNAWLGTRARVGAHFDAAHNIACVVAGRRVFTLFPTEQLPNLYVGPLDLTPAGRPMSLVDFHAPDFRRFPRFRGALENAQLAELEPGDALFIPSLWWHHVESLDSYNMLINYWWNEPGELPDSPTESLLHCLLTMRNLSNQEREAWRAIFDYYIFRTAEAPMAHVPPDRRGIVARPMAEDAARRLRGHLLNCLNR